MNQWDKQAIDGYRFFCRTFLPTVTKRLDCADLAIYTLCKFAEKEHLPLQFRYGSNTILAYDPEIDNIEPFLTKARAVLGTYNLLDDRNTVALPVAMAMPGDMLITDRHLPPPRIGTHTRVLQSRDESDKWLFFAGDYPPTHAPRPGTVRNISAMSHFAGVRRWRFENFTFQHTND